MLGLWNTLRRQVVTAVRSTFHNRKQKEKKATLSHILICWSDSRWYSKCVGWGFLSTTQRERILNESVIYQAAPFWRLFTACIGSIVQVVSHEEIVKGSFTFFQILNICFQPKDVGEGDGSYCHENWGTLMPDDKGQNVGFPSHLLAAVHARSPADPYSNDIWHTGDDRYTQWKGGGHEFL